MTVMAYPFFLFYGRKVYVHVNVYYSTYLYSCTNIASFHLLFSLKRTKFLEPLETAFELI
jgi:hypothetical protein